MAGAARARTLVDRWAAIHDPAMSLVVEPTPAPTGAWVGELLAQAPFTWRITGPAATVATGLADAAPELQRLVSAHARRFAELMGVGDVTVRVEAVTGNACTRLHADYTDVRLIVTLAGPGTEHVGGRDPAAPVREIPTGHVALFKGRTYPGADGCRHMPCLHRSPQIAGTGTRRLVLVIDTARPDAEQG